MMRLFVVVMLFGLGTLQSAQAQNVRDAVWVQIEAQPNLREATERAREYARELEDVSGFALGGGWFGIALGPYTRADAEQVLRVYRSERLIPRDSYIALSSTYRQQFWPDGANILSRGTIASAPVIAAIAPPVEKPTLQQTPAPATEVTPDDETPNQARRSERNLSRAEREELQIALKWAGFYNSTIDGAFGRGTRRSMSDWQRFSGFDDTGVLTTRQRTVLIGQYNAVLEELGLQTVSDQDAGIEIEIPTKMVQFDRYEAPFGQYNAINNSGARVLLISQTGNRDTMAGLYDIMQTLEIVPRDGPRSIESDGFSLVGQNSAFISETWVKLTGNQIKGFTLIWPADDDARRARLLAEMKASFKVFGGTLDPAAGASDQQVDLVAGLQIRKPLISRSGFYVDERGTIATTIDAVQSCGRITLDGETEANLSAQDTASGIAFLKPTSPLAPAAIAQFSPTPPRLESDVAVAGYSFGGVLGAPSITFGILSDLRGLAGETDLNRLAITALPGDIGGPVFDASGNVFGMLLPRPSGGRQLPEDVNFALAGASISTLMLAAGLSPAQGDPTDALAPEDITQRGLGMTVLVSCWE